MNRFTISKIAFNNGDSDSDVSAISPLPVVLIPRTKTVAKILDGVIVDGASSVHEAGAAARTMQASLRGTGTLTGTLTWYGSNVSGVDGFVISTMVLDCTDSKVLGAQDSYEWPYVWCVLTRLTGTNAIVTATLAV